MKRLALLPILLCLGMFTLGAVGCADEAGDDAAVEPVGVETDEMEETEAP